VTLPLPPRRATDQIMHTTLYSIALIAWIGGGLVSFVNGHRRLPSTAVIVGLALVVWTLMGKARYFDLTGMAILAAIIWIASEADAKNAERIIMAKAICCAVAALVVLVFCLIFFLSPVEHYPLPIPNEAQYSSKIDYYDWVFCDALRQLRLIISPLVSVALLLLAMRLRRQLRARRRERITHEEIDA
jgi:mannose/fructose/N-acetylgalactosamine-specific phosphotransferase system component IIC